METPMTFRQSTLPWIVLAMLVTAMLVACGDPKYQPPAIMLAFSQGFIPPASLNTGAYAGIAATVTNDPKNGGVGFSCTPNTPFGACGTFSPTSAGSGIPVCYLAPDSVPNGNTVTVTATSASDPTKSISGTITIVNTGVPNPCP
jgi:hypothetical protein